MQIPSSVISFLVFIDYNRNRKGCERVEGKTQIRLVASDLDGTLLNDQKQFPPDFSEVLRALERKKIRFAAASGRSYATLRDDFTRAAGEDTAGKMDYICDNGAFIVEGGKIACVHTMDKRLLRELIAVSQDVPDVLLLLCGMRGTYHLPYTPVFAEKARSYEINHREVEDLSRVEDDIFKVAICDLRGPEKNIFPVLAPLFRKSFELQISGPLWMDVMNPGVDKGSALKTLQQHHGISREETVAFGDFCNDIGLLKNAGYSFAMANAHPEVFRWGRYLAESNNACGVTAALRRYVLNEEPWPKENPLFCP